MTDADPKPSSLRTTRRRPPLAVMASTILAYQGHPGSERHAQAAGDWVVGPDHPCLGGSAAAAVATGGSLFEGTSGTVGTAIGEGAAARPGSGGWL